MIQHTQCRTVYDTLYEKKGTLCFQGLHIVLDSAFGSRISDECSWCAQGRTGLFAWMERTRQRHVFTCGGPRHLESSASRQTGFDLHVRERKTDAFWNQDTTYRLLVVVYISWETAT